MEQRHRRSQQEPRLEEACSLQPQEKQELPSDVPQLKKGQRLQPLPSGGHMIITTGFDA